MLALRYNPNVQQAQLNQELQQRALKVEEWQFKPHYALTASRVTTRYYSVENTNGPVTANVTGIQPVTTLVTPIGTQLTLAGTHNISDHYNPGVSFQIMQPLLRGFGNQVVEAALNTAIDNEKISRLNVEGSIRSTVTNVINAYLDYISARHTLAIDKEILSRTEESVFKTRSFIKSGQKAPVELITVEADRANARTLLANDENVLEQTRINLLNVIGIDPGIQLQFSDIKIDPLLVQYHTPSLEEAKQMILRNDIQYQVDRITLEGAKQRSILLAKDNLRWQLNVTVNARAGNSSGGGKHSGLNSIINGVNETNSLTLDLNVPIDDQASKNALAAAKINLKQAEIALREEAWTNEAKIINGWNAIRYSRQQLHLAENAAHLQAESFNISAQKYAHGLIDGFELQTSRGQLTHTQHVLINSRINYLKALANLDWLTGNTLRTWGINDKYIKYSYKV